MNLSFFAKFEHIDDKLINGILFNVQLGALTNNIYLCTCN